MRALSKEKQRLIEQLHYQGVSKAKIAREVGCHVQTIDRHLDPKAREYHRMRSRKRNEETKDKRSAQNKLQRTRTTHESIVYVLYSADHGLYKIGYTVNLTYRLRQMHCPDLGLLRYFPGDKDLEWFIHDKLHIRRVHGEWFKFDSPDEAAQTIANLVSEYRLTGSEN